MSHARRRLPGATYGLAIRCSERRCFLAPSLATTLLLRFMLACYAAKHGIQLHGFAFLSNHYHLVLTDVRGSLGDFMRDLNAQVARVLNARFGRGENLFSSRGYEAWELESNEVAGHLAYVINNPVAAGLVRAPAEWPGLISLPEDYERGPRRVRQPEVGFYGRGPSKALPEQVDLELTPPPGYATPAAFVADLRFHLQAETQASLADFGPGHVWLPPAALRDQDPKSAPPGGTRPTFQIRPHLARGASAERRAELKAWREAYAHALYAWRAGVRDVVFPAGTFRMARLHRARVAPLH